MLFFYCCTDAKYRCIISKDKDANASLTSFRPQQLAKAFRRGVYTFLANIADEERMEESAEDMTAADTAPRPITATQVGVRNCITIGNASG